MKLIILYTFNFWLINWSNIPISIQDHWWHDHHRSGKTAVDEDFFLLLVSRKSMQRNKQMAMGRKKFNMDPKKVKEFIVEFYCWYCCLFQHHAKVCSTFNIPLFNFVFFMTLTRCCFVCPRREFDFWWTVHYWKTPVMTLPSFSTRGRGLIKRPLGTTWGRGQRLSCFDKYCTEV